MDEVEAVARAIAKIRYGDDEFHDENHGVPYWQLCEREARAAIAALDECRGSPFATMP
jgi:hypothetical protein